MTSNAHVGAGAPTRPGRAQLDNSAIDDGQARRGIESFHYDNGLARLNVRACCEWAHRSHPDNRLIGACKVVELRSTRAGEGSRPYMGIAGDWQ
jgi:hypothetical protein